MAEMEFRVFDGKEDAYWWLLCIEEHFKKRDTPDEEKLTDALMLLRGRARQWSHWWNRRHQQVSWHMFSLAFIWRFKPEYRDIMPMSDEEEEPETELEWLTTQGSFNIQPQDSDQGNPNPTAIGEEKGLEDVEMGKIERYVENAHMHVMIVEMEQESKTDLCKLICNKEMSMGSEIRGTTIGTTTSIIMYFFLKNIITNRVYDQGISLHDSHIALSLYFKLWDPGGHL